MIKRTILFLAILVLQFNFSQVFSQTWQDYEKLMLENYQQANFNLAIEYGEKAIALLKDSDPTKVNYGSVLNNLAYVYLQTKEFEKAEKAYLEVLEIITPVLGKNHRIYARTINYLGEIQVNTRNYTSSEKYLLEAASIRKSLLPESIADYLYTLSLLKKLYSVKNQYHYALNYQDTVINLTKKSFGETSLEYLNELFNKALIYRQSGDNLAGQKVIEEAFENQAIKNTNTPEIRNFLFSLAAFDRSTGNHRMAIKIAQELVKKSEKLPANNQEFGHYQTYLGLLYAETGGFEKALENYNKALTFFKKQSIENTGIALVLNNIAVLKYNMGEFIESEQYHLKAKEIRSNLLGKNHPDYVSSLNGLGALYHSWGNLDKAENQFIEAITILDKLNLKNDEYFTIAGNLGQLYDDKGEYMKSADTYLLAYKTGEKLYGLNSLEMASVLKRTGDLHRKYGNLEFAEFSYNESIKSTLSSVGKSSPFYAEVLNNRGIMFLYGKNYQKAEKDLLESFELYKSIFGNDHFQCAVALNNLGSLYYSLNDKKKAEKYLINANEILINQTNNNLAYLTAQESEAYLNSTDYLIEAYYSFYLSELKRNESLAGFAYDNVLSRKGLLLQSEKNLRQSILKTKDAALVSDYLHFIEMKEQIANHLNTTPNILNDSLLKLQQQVEILEKKLATNSSVFELRDQYSSIGWKEVQKNLKKNEIAIEFIRFRYHNLLPTDSVFYCALILDPSYKFPKMLFLFEEKELQKLIDKNHYKTDEAFISALYHKTKRNEYGQKPANDSVSNSFSKLIWSPLEPYLKNKETIFYSPAGLLNLVSFAALSINDSAYVSDKFRLHALLSTRNLVSHKRFTKSGTSKISLYGGIEYDLEAEELKNMTRAFHHDSLKRSQTGNLKKLIANSKRGENWNYLHGTLEEVETIEAIFKGKEVEIESYKGKNAVEETFKQYMGDLESPNIIHIATHGFFFDDNQADKKQNVPVKSIFKQAENPLLRSGLLFAGANRIWNNLEIPEGSDDGILTAYEVANTNLNETELVVLSACETGLGEINGSEGVYGLQRSFKIAGAEYIIMSLWQIPDFQTAELMKSFYTYRSQNITIPEAFQQAQNEMKMKYLPYFWASFVLIK